MKQLSSNVSVATIVASHASRGVRHGALLSQKNWAPLVANTPPRAPGRSVVPDTSNRVVFVTRVSPLLLCALDLTTRICTPVPTAADAVTKGNSAIRVCVYACVCG
eukprot:m.1243981 g.1243981  ORF g.1243981 m.1243981 type:complete len:106 (-) comp24684_c0_seq17:2896-3213(-)